GLGGAGAVLRRCRVRGGGAWARRGSPRAAVATSVQSPPATRRAGGRGHAAARQARKGGFRSRARNAGPRGRGPAFPGAWTAAPRVAVNGIPASAPVKAAGARDRKSTRLNSSHVKISYAVFCLQKKTRRHPTVAL